MKRWVLLLISLIWIWPVKSQISAQAIKQAKRAEKARKWRHKRQWITLWKPVKPPKINTRRPPKSRYGQSTKVKYKGRR